MASYSLWEVDCHLIDVEFTPKRIGCLSRDEQTQIRNRGAEKLGYDCSVTTIKRNA